MTAAFRALAAGMLFATPTLMAQAVAPANADLEPGGPFLDNAINGGGKKLSLNDSLPFAQWPKTLKEIAAELGTMAGS